MQTTTWTCSRDQPAPSRVRLYCRHARLTDWSGRRLPHDADSRSEVRGARDDRCRARGKRDGILRRRLEEIRFARDSPLEGGVTSELVSGIRGSGPHFGILFPPLTRPRARAREGPPLWADLPPRRTRVRNEMLEPSGGFYNVRRVSLGCGPAPTRQGFPLVVFAPGASTASRCGGSSGPS